MEKTGYNWPSKIKQALALIDEVVAYGVPTGHSRAVLKDASAILDRVLAEAKEQAMEKARYRRLELTGERLTEAEVAEGWHYCPDWDGMLINRFTGEECTCRFNSPLIEPPSNTE